jgi:glycerate kinase
VTDSAGQPCTPDARGMYAARHLDLTGLDARLAAAAVVAVTDVDCPLAGPTGAAHVFGPQKGLEAADIERLDPALARWGRLLEQVSGRSADARGSGAAGGVGAAIVSALGGTVVGGASYILDAVHLDDALTGASLVVTGEGSWDAQSAMGKAPHEVVRRATDRGVPVAIVAGRIDPRVAFGLGVVAAYSLVDLAPDHATAIAGPGPLLVQIGSRIGQRLHSLETAGTTSWSR